MSSANKNSLLPFLYLSLLFCFSYLIVLAVSRFTLNKSCDSGHHCLVCDFRGKIFSYSSFNTQLALSLLQMTFIWLILGSFLCIFFRVFINEWSCCQRPFLHLLRWPYDFCLIFYLCNVLHLLFILVPLTRTLPDHDTWLFL